MDVTPAAVTASGLESASILTTLTRPSYSLESWSSIGAICLHGPHHVAQMSTTTGMSESMTSVVNVASVTVVVLMRGPPTVFRCGIWRVWQRGSVGHLRLLS